MTRKDKHMGLIFRTFSRQQVNYKGFFTFYLIMAFIVSVAGVLMTRVTGDMGQAAVDLDRSSLLYLFAFFTGVMIIRAIASAMSAYYLGRFAGKLGYHFRYNFAKYFLLKPFAALENTKSGEALSVYSNDLPATVELTSRGGIRLIADVINLVVMASYLIYLNWWLTLIFFASFPVLIVLQVLISSPIEKKSARRLEARSAINTIANDSFQNTGLVAAYSLEGIMEERCRNAFEEWITVAKDMAKSYILLIFAGVLASFAPLLIVIAVSAGQVISDNMNISEWIVFISLAGEAGSWLLMLAQRQNSISTTAAGARRLDEAMTDRIEDIHSGKILTPTGSVAISVENLRFSYRTDDEAPLVLDGVTFQIMKGEKVAFVGGSGCGKSTILKLLLGLYKPQSGSITVFGTNVSEASLFSLRDVYTYVPQDSFLFPESIVENITGESGCFDRERLDKACRDAGIMTFIDTLPKGYYEELNESAENVSGGQKQRIALARSFYRDAPIILFDEATSALDPATEASVLQSFSSSAKDRTVIMVAHRAKAIEFCDTIVVMDKGRIVAIGSHDCLVKESAVYANLYEARLREALA